MDRPFALVNKCIYSENGSASASEDSLLGYDLDVARKLPLVPPRPVDTVSFLHALSWHYLGLEFPDPVVWFASRPIVPPDMH